MASSYVLSGWSPGLLQFVLLLSLKGLTTAFNVSNISSSPTISPIFSLSVVSTSSSILLTTTITTTTRTVLTTRTTRTAHAPPSSQHSIIPSQTHTVSSSSSIIPTTNPKQTIMNKKLSSFGIVMLCFGGILVVVLIVCLTVICCHGRERGPEGTHIPHSNVKMKPWKSSEISTTNELTEDTVDVLDQPNHSQSHHNVGLTTSPQTSPTLATPSSNNNKISTPTGSFRNLQTHSPSGDLGEFGRKLSLGRQAYELDITPNETIAEHNVAQKAKGEQDDMTIHYV